MKELRFKAQKLKEEQNNERMKTCSIKKEYEKKLKKLQLAYCEEKSQSSASWEKIDILKKKLMTE